MEKNKLYDIFDKVNKTLNDKKEIEIVKNCYEKNSLNKDFLDVSHKSPKKVFKQYCKKNNIQVDWDEIKEKLKKVKTITHDLKKRYKRPRPKKYLKNSILNNTHDMFSYSFPSGHTCTARFVAELLSKMHPEHTSDFLMISDLIGQSRLENGVHYETDVLWGKFLGEVLANTLDE